MEYWVRMPPRPCPRSIFLAPTTAWYFWLPTLNSCRWTGRNQRSSDVNHEKLLGCHRGISARVVDVVVTNNNTLSTTQYYFAFTGHSYARFIGSDYRLRLPDSMSTVCPRVWSVFLIPDRSVNVITHLPPSRSLPCISMYYYRNFWILSALLTISFPRWRPRHIDSCEWLGNESGSFRWLRKKKLTLHWLQFRQLSRGNKTPLQSIAKSHICLNSEVKPINLSTQNKNDKTSKNLSFAKNSKTIKAGETWVKYEKVGGPESSSSSRMYIQKGGGDVSPFSSWGRSDWEWKPINVRLQPLAEVMHMHNILCLRCPL